MGLQKKRRHLRYRALSTALVVLTACGVGEKSEPSLEPDVSDAGVDAEVDAGEPYPLWVDVGQFIPGGYSELGNNVAYDLDGEAVLERECMTGPKQLQLIERDVRVVELADADEATLRAAMGSATGEGSFGHDHMLQDIYDTMTAPHSMTVLHVHSVETGTRSFRGTPEPTGEPCDAYASQELLGARYAVGLKFEFSSAEAVRAFREENDGLSLEEILRYGPTTAPLSVDDEWPGVSRIYVVLARLGGELRADFPWVTSDCNTGNLRGCASLLDELDVYAESFLDGLAPPREEDIGQWATVRTDVTHVAPAVVDESASRE
jgi:hypothetical protein